MMMDQAHFSEYLLRQQMLHAASLSGLQHRVGADAEPPVCEGRLLNGDLWRRFHDIGTEMIITKGGRSFVACLLSGYPPSLSAILVQERVRERGARAPTSCGAVGRPPRAPPSACSTNNQIMTANSQVLNTSTRHSSLSPEKLTADIHMPILDQLIIG
ncbi:unnamed protein product [Pieris macdunnoughi]|uniref:T-box domain-containing protein n=1 Tax=Pieris macdunnoughi TaxID=345717 RepID=A0A821X8Y4_9NEOP|nr:unnamed protein product [Pieris macdunnoughi]